MVPLGDLRVIAAIIATLIIATIDNHYLVLDKIN
jgi:hypothetical protein